MGNLIRDKIGGCSKSNENVGLIWVQGVQSGKIIVESASWKRLKEKVFRERAVVQNFVLQLILGF